MSLVNRVSLFFLAALGLVLIVYSLLFYGLVQRQLQQQFDQQLQSALHTLVAAVEVEEDDVKWEPSDHTIGMGIEDGLEDVRWTVYDEYGKIMDRSKNLLDNDPASQELLSFGREQHTDGNMAVSMGGWRVLQRRMAAVRPKAVELRDPQERGAVVVTVGRSPADLNANLRGVAMLVCLLPLAAWLIAAAAVRWFCATALAPVREMAAQARAMSGDNFNLRLPVAKTHDELADLGLAFNSLLDLLAEAFARQQRFTGDAAHQLRTPLTALLGQIDVALRRPREPEEYTRTLHVLREQTLDLQKVVEGLLYLARAGDDSKPLDIEQLDLHQWLPKFLAPWRQHARGADLQLDNAAQACLDTSPALLGQLLDNLVNNALKYSPAGSPVVVACSQQAGAVTLAVHDQGRGIAPEELKEVFKPFYRSELVRRAGVAGTGLGLPLAQRLASALGGELTCRSTLGRGSTFSVTFPARCSETQTPEKLADANQHAQHE